MGDDPIRPLPRARAEPKSQDPKLKELSRQLAFRTGISAESRAAALLIAKGFRIVARRFKSPVGEIDIVARRRSLLIFVEVKARPDLEEAAWSVTERQRARIIAAAGAWLARYPDERIRYPVRCGPGRAGADSPTYHHGVRRGRIAARRASATVTVASRAKIK
jgi:putative endonuclease